MSKRAHSTTESPSKRKRVKVQSNQFKIDHFFSSPSPTKLSDTRPQFVQGSSKSNQHINHDKPANSDALELEVIDVDDLYCEVERVEHVQAAPSTPTKRIIKEEESPHLSTKGKHRETIRPIDPSEFLPLNVDPSAYVPALQPTASSMASYSLLTQALVALSQTRSRIAIINILTNVLRTIIAKHPSSLLPAVYLLSNSLGPQFIAIELGLGSSIITRAIRQISGLSSAALKRLYNDTGDPGDVAFSAKSNIRTLIPHPPLSIPYVYESLLRIARCNGQGAAKEKQKVVEKLLLAASGEEVRYLTRTLCQNLRVGAVRTSILTALARAMVLTPPSSILDQTVIRKVQVAGQKMKASVASPSSPPVSSSPKPKARADNQISLFKQAESLIKQVYVKHPSYDEIIPALLEGGLDSLAERVPLTVGVPLLPMLGSPTRSLDEIYRRLGDNPFSAEFKYDGQRAQIHASCGSDKNLTVKIFSRHLEDMTSKYPDVIGLVQHFFDSSNVLTSFIMDAEIVASDPVTGALKSFQELSGRARKNVNLKDVQVAVCVYAFDLMYLNDEPLLERTFRERRTLLRTTFSPRKVPQEDMTMAYFDFVESCESSDRSLIEDFMLKAIENRCEGLMIKLLEDAKVSEETSEKQSRLKSLPSTYQPDIRTLGWLKLKKDYIDGMGDSIDVIPVGAWHGNGRKAKWWSPVLLALWNPETGRPVALCKCMSGFTDAFYMSMRDMYSPDSGFCSNKSLWDCDFGGFRPDVYFKPREVWEIRGADITESPVSTAAQGSVVSSTRGLSLRFPRFIRVRDDKTVEIASTPSFLVDVWKGQQGKPTNKRGNDDGDLIDISDTASVVDVEQEDSSDDHEVMADDNHL